MSNRGVVGDDDGHGGHVVDDIIRQQEQYFEVDYVKHLGDIYNAFYDVLFDLLDQSREELCKRVKESSASGTIADRDRTIIDQSLERLSERMVAVLDSNYDAFEILCRDLFVLPENFNRDTARVFLEVAHRKELEEEEEEGRKQQKTLVVDQKSIVARLRERFSLLAEEHKEDEQVDEMGEEDDEEGDAVMSEELRQLREQINAEVRRHMELQEEEAQLEHNLKVFEHNKDKLTAIDRVLENKEDLTRDLLKRIVQEYETLRELAIHCKSLYSELEGRRVFRTAHVSPDADEEGMQSEETGLRKELDRQTRINPNIQTMLEMMDEDDDD